MDTAPYDARTDGVASETGGIMDVKLLHEMIAMFFNGLDADAQICRDLLVGLAFGNELEHFHLA
jgi:hypothetical protein